jgi:hypothetical protein
MKTKKAFGGCQTRQHPINDNHKMHDSFFDRRAYRLVVETIGAV